MLCVRHRHVREAGVKGLEAAEGAQVLPGGRLRVWNGAGVIWVVFNEPDREFLSGCEREMTDAWVTVHDF